MNSFSFPPSRVPTLEMVQLEKAWREERARHAARGGLIKFVRYFWDVLEPKTKFVDGWAIQAICEHLEAVSRGEITRLLLNVPPGFAKSLIVNVFWPAWEWSIYGAHLRYVSFSYAAHLTARDNEKFRDLLLSYKYQQLYGSRFKLVKVGSEKVQSDKTGWKFASSVGGVGTGERGDRVLLDDPHNVKEAESETVRTETVRWFREAMQNRLNDLATGVIVVIMQRVHEADVSGCIIENYPEYVHLCIPMEFEESRLCETEIGWADPRDEEGELAWPERYPAEVLTPFRSMPFLWAGQYQQRPEPRGGGIIKRDYWRIWNREAQEANDVKPGMFPNFEFVLASFDGAFTEKKENDYSALTIWGVWVETSIEQRYSEQFGTPRLMLIWAWHKRLTLHGTDVEPLPGETKAEFEDRRKQSWGVVEHIAADCKKHHVDKLIIENKANGITVEQEMRRLFSRESWTVALHDPGKMDKAARAYTVQHLFSDGLVWRPDTDWAQLVEDELASMPRGAHDDLADASINAIIHLRRMNLAQRQDESFAAIENMLYGKAPIKRLNYEA